MSESLEAAAALLSLVRERASTLGHSVCGAIIHFGAEDEDPESVRVDYRRYPGGVLRWSEFDAEMSSLLASDRARLVEIIDHELKGAAA